MLRIVVISFIIFSQSVYAQSSVDSLVQLLNRADDSVKVHILLQLWDATEYVDNTKSIHYARQGLAIARKIKYPLGEALCLKYIGNSKINKQQLDSTIFYHNQSIAILKKLHNDQLIAGIYTSIAGMYQSKGDYAAAEIYLDSASTLAEQTGDNENIARIDLARGSIEYYKGNFLLSLKHLLKAEPFFADSMSELHYADLLVLIGNAHHARKNYARAIELYGKPEAIYIRNQDDYYLAQLYNNKGNCYLSMNDFDSAKYYFSKSLALAVRAENYYIQINLLGNIGKYYNAINKPDSSYYYHKESNKLAFRYNILQEVAAEYNSCAHLFHNKKDYASCLVMLDSAAYYGKKLGSKDQLIDTYNLYAKVFSAIGNERQSYRYFRLYDELKDSVFNIEKNRQMAEMEAIYENEKKTQEIALRNKDITILSRDLKIESAQRKFFLVLGVSITGLLIFSVVGYTRKIKRDRKIRAIEKQKDEERRKNLELEKKLLNKELEIKRREITSYTLNLIKKNEFLESIGSELKVHSNNDSVAEVKSKLSRLIQNNRQFDLEWENFRIHFEEVHQDFFDKLKMLFPNISPMEIRLASFMKLNLSAKEIASIMNVTPESLKKARYRLKKKMISEDERDISDILLAL